MKKFLMVVLVLMFAVVLSAGDKKLVSPTPVVTAEKVVTWDDFRQAQEDANKYDLAEEHEKAVESYLMYADIGEKLGRMDLKAWGLNNASYVIIKLHKKDQSVSLTDAKAFLERGMEIEEAKSYCREKMIRNMDYVKYWLGKKAEPKKEIKK